MFAVLKHLFKLQFLIILIAVFAGIYYPQILEKIKSLIFEISSSSDNEPIAVKFSAENDIQLFSKAALAKFNGENEDEPIYLSILGSVYDVSKGRKHYGTGCSYSYFAGKDASKSFITGEFQEFDENSDDVMALKPSEVLSLYDWKKFYDKEYIFKGLSIGRFYDKNGAKTEYHHKLDAIANQALEDKITSNKNLEAYPSCNIEWSEKTGTRVWCTDQSGGKKRDWIGFPRKYYEAGKEDYRCACIETSELNSPNLKPYENCDPLSRTCFYKVE
ncbi:neuferricin homolog [Eupeodes corollae]|uniref:neuferricin homolog n=1 Tax=Eupeodes corollae TaxID=290404 RepID=UPI0024925110|nr:neuferricin homolog [Eupeodes corollae]